MNTWMYSMTTSNTFITFILEFIQRRREGGREGGRESVKYL